MDPLADEYLSYSPYNYVLGNPISLIDPFGRDTWAVHGTWSNASTGYCPPSQSNCDEEDSSAALWQDYLEDDGELHFFEWGEDGLLLEKDNNHHSSRIVAALRLVELILEAYRADPKISINILGHSHGGNVGIMAATLLHEQYGLTVDNLVIFGTPSRDDYRIGRDAVDNFTSVYNEYDAVQVSGGNWTESPYLPGRGELGEIGSAGRIHPGATNLNVTAWMHPSFGSLRGNFRAHSVMQHSTMVMQAVHWLNNRSD